MKILKIIFTVLGLIALSALIWFGLTYLELDQLIYLVPSIGVVWVVAGLIWMLGMMRRRRAAAGLEEGIAESAADDTPILKDKLQDALGTLKKSSGRSGSAYLYELPWYIIIGPPGSGKTTALVNSGLKFPLAGPGGAEAIAGVGGTRHCDWWFTEEAVIIDTAGRYTTQDSDSEADARSWTGFLDMLAEHRPRQPINGVLVCISVEDLLTLPTHEIELHANAIRRRLDELHTKLKISFPVYVMLTKLDLVAGFMEFFGDLAPEQRAMVWGTTFNPKQKTDNMVAAFAEEFDELMMALSDQMTDRMEMEPDARARALIFSFPAQMASLKEQVNTFLVKVFEPSRYQSEAAIRGVYFTSGTQEGTPIDRVIGALGRNFGTKGAAVAPFSGQGKSFFLTDLLQRVIFPESGWVSTNLAHVRRNFIVKSVMYVLLFLGVGSVGGLWGYSYLQNSELQAQTDHAVDEYRELASNIINETKVGDGDLHTVLQPLDKLRFMPAGYASQGDPVPVTAGFGLSQHDRLRDANTETYRDALDRLLLPRLIYRLEQLLEKNIKNTAFVYEGLKVYLMLGGQARMDEELVKTWMSRDWENLYPGASNAKGRERLMDHLEAAMERPSSAVALNGPLVEEAQRTLARMPVADRAYTLMKTNAEGRAYPAWNAARRGGPDAALVFETRDGAPLDQVEVPGFFTYEGFHDGVLSQMDFMIERIKSERWVLGDVGSQAAIDAQFATIRRDIMGHYRAEFTNAWDEQMSRLRIASVGGGDDLTVMSALAAPTSPLRQLMISLTEETKLTEVRGEPEGEGGNAALEQAGAKAATKAAGRLGQAGKAAQAGVGLALNTLDQESGGVAINYGEEIEAHFKQLHEFAAAAAGGQAPVDNLISRFNSLYQAMNLMKAGGEARQQGLVNMQAELQALKAEMARMPGMVANMTEDAALTLEGIAVGSSKSQLNQALGDQVARQCQQIISNRYPFFGNAQREVPMADFARLFGPNGIMNTFFEQKLVGMVDQSAKNWRWRGDTDLSRTLSNQALRQFERAALIRDAFFAGGGGLPSVNFSVLPVTLSPDAYTVTFDVNGQKLEYDHRAARPLAMSWPGPAGGRVAVSMTPELPGQRNEISQTGEWGLMRLIRQGAALNQGDSMSVNFAIGGRDASFTIQASSVINPFSLTALSEFRCPIGF